MGKKSGRPLFIALVIAVLAITGYFLTRPYLFLESGGKVLLAFPTRAQDAFSLRFIHSVQKTPVLENLSVDKTCDGFELLSTKYQSFGVGLPFLESEGTFREQGDYFIFDHMDRAIPHLAVRTGVGTKLTFIYRGVSYPLYERVPIGSKIEIKIKPYYQRFYDAIAG